MTDNPYIFFSLLALTVTAAILFVWFTRPSSQERREMQKRQWDAHILNRLDEKFELLETLLETYDLPRLPPPPYGNAHHAHGFAQALKADRNELLRLWRVKQPRRLVDDSVIPGMLDDLWESFFVSSQQVEFMTAYEALKGYHDTGSFG